ncbi:MAG: cytochrome-c peroxidase [Planctomycetota bacterium]
MRANKRLGLSLCPALSAILFATAPLHAQNTVNSGLQADISMTTPGGWLWPAADPGNPQPNPATPYLKDRINLGKALFWDEQVSTSNTMACGTCHKPESGGIDPRRPGKTFNAFGQLVLGSFGTIPQSQPGGPGTPIDYGFTAPPSNQATRGITPIHVPTMIGAYMFRRQFWGLTAGPQFNFSGGGVLFPDWSALENQAVGPPTNEIEMGHQNLAWATGVLERKLNQEQPLALAVPGTIPSSIPGWWMLTSYHKVFDIVFSASANPAIAAPQGVTRERFAMALASYMRTLIPDQAPIDTGTMTPQEELGFDIFVSSGCAACHSVSGNPTLVMTGGPSGILADPWDNPFSDGQPHNIFFADPSRDIGPIKTPTLRNVGLRTRFFHDGLGRVIAGAPNNTLPDIVDFYDLDQDPAAGGPGGPFELRSLLTPSPTLTPGERNAVIAFLRNALTDPRVAGATPPFDRPKLYTDAFPFRSNITRPSTAGGLWRPRMISDVPPLVEKVGGPSWWKVGVGSQNASFGAPIIPPGSVATLWMGNSDTAAGPFYLTGASALVNLPTTSQGFATAHVPVPLSATMIGTMAFLQWSVLDPFGTLGFSESSFFIPL